MPRPFAISKSETFPYVLETNREDPEGERVTFRCRTLTGGQRTEVLRYCEMTPTEPGQRSTTMRGTIDACRKAIEFGLVGWDNMTRPDGKPEPWRSPTHALQVLGPEAQMEVGGEILSRANLEADAGNA